MAAGCVFSSRINTYPRLRPTIRLPLRVSWMLVGIGMHATLEGFRPETHGP